MITTITGSDTLTQEKHFVEIKIPQETEKIIYYSPAFGSSIVCITIIILTGMYVEPVVIIAGLLFCFFIHIFLFLVDRYLSPFPAGTPDIFRIYPDEKISLYFWRSALPDTPMSHTVKWYLSKTYKVVYINTKYRKLLKSEWLEENGKRWFGTYSAPMFEKCQQEWKQLFEEIRKHLPEDAKIIVKESNVGESS